MMDTFCNRFCGDWPDCECGWPEDDDEDWSAWSPVWWMDEGVVGEGVER